MGNECKFFRNKKSYDILRYFFSTKISIVSYNFKFDDTTEEINKSFTEDYSKQVLHSQTD